MPYNPVHYYREEHTIQGGAPDSSSSVFMVLLFVETMEVIFPWASPSKLFSYDTDPQKICGKVSCRICPLFCPYVVFHLLFFPSTLRPVTAAPRDYNICTISAWKRAHEERL